MVVVGATGKQFIHCLYMHEKSSSRSGKTVHEFNPGKETVIITRSRYLGCSRWSSKLGDVSKWFEVAVLPKMMMMMQGSLLPLWNTLQIITTLFPRRAFHHLRRRSSLLYHRNSFFCTYSVHWEMCLPLTRETWHMLFTCFKKGHLSGGLKRPCWSNEPVGKLPFVKQHESSSLVCTSPRERNLITKGSDQVSLTSHFKEIKHHCRSADRCLQFLLWGCYQ